MSQDQQQDLSEREADANALATYAARVAVLEGEVASWVEQLGLRTEALNRVTATRDRYKAERDDLQQQIANVQALLICKCGCGGPASAVQTSDLRAALGGSAVSSRPGMTVTEAVADALNDRSENTGQITGGTPQEPQPTPEADAWDAGWTASEKCDAPGPGRCGDCDSCNVPNPYRNRHRSGDERQQAGEAMCGAYVGKGWDGDCHCILRPEHAGECRCTHTVRQPEPQPAPEAKCTCVPFPQGTGPEEDCPIHGMPQPTPEAHETRTGRVSDFFAAGHEPKSEPVERITDANGDELEHGADTDAQTAQQQDGGEGPLRHQAHCPYPVYPCACAAQQQDRSDR